MGKHLRLRAKDSVAAGDVVVLVLRTGREVAVEVTAPAGTKIVHAKGSAPPTVPFRPAPKTDLDPAA